MLKISASGFDLDWCGVALTWLPALVLDGTKLPGTLLEGGQSNTAVFRISPDASWHFRWRFEGDTLLLDSDIENHGAKPIALGKALPLDARCPAAFALNGEDTVALLNTAGQGPCLLNRVTDADAQRQSKVLFQFYRPSRKLALQVGFQTFLRADTVAEYDYAPQAGFSGLRAVCDFAGWKLAPGARTPVETLVLRAGADPLAQLTAWADRVNQDLKPNIWPGSPLGFVGGSWTDMINSKANHETIALETIDAINARLKGFGFEYLWVSISNLPGGNPGDWLGWNTDNFDSDAPELVRKCREKNWKLGLWHGAFYISSTLPNLEEFRDALLKAPNGELMVVRGEWQHGDAGRLPKAKRPRLYALDPTHPKSLAFIRHVFETYRKWGVAYFMVDFVEGGAGTISRFPYLETHDQSKVHGPEAYRVFMDAIREAAGPETYLLASSGPFLHNAGVTDGVRTGGDFGEGRCLNPESFFYPATYVINNMSFWTGARCALVNQAGRFYTHRKLFVNDSGNVLTVDLPIPLSHARINATIHTMSGGASMLGDDIRSIAEERLALIKATLPRPLDVATPIDLFTSPAPVGPRIFHRRIQKEWGRFDVVAVYNLSDKPATITVDFDALGLDTGHEYLTWEFWDRKFVGKVRERLTVNMPEESVKIFRLVENTGHPVLLATDMHMTMGEMDVQDASYHPDTRTFRVKAVRPAGEKGGVYVYAPDDVHVVNFEGVHIAKDGRDNSLVLYIPFDFKDGVAGRDIVFGGLKEILDMSKLELA